MLGFRGTTAGGRAFPEGINHLCRHLANCQLSHTSCFRKNGFNAGTILACAPG